jgi:hypothetical protein
MPALSFDPIADAAAVAAVMLMLLDRKRGKKGGVRGDGNLVLFPMRPVST